MMDIFWTALGASCIAAVVTAMGIFTIRRFEQWGKKYSIYFVSFAAGLLISVSLLHIIPKSFSMNADAAVYLLLGFVVLHLLNHFLTAFACDHEPGVCHHSGLIPIAGIAFHSFIDGIVYSVTFSVSIFTGILAATGMVLHEFPEGIIAFMLLVRGGYSTRTSLLLAFLAASLLTPLGVLVSYPLVSQINESWLGILLSLSSGVLLYVGATHLLPQTEREHRPLNLLLFACGILLAVLIVLSK